jgi:hypothetical protein
MAFSDRQEARRVYAQPLSALAPATTSDTNQYLDMCNVDQILSNSRQRAVKSRHQNATNIISYPRQTNVFLN